MKYLRIKNWEVFQHYKDRNPPWIKLHKEILSSRTWVSVSDQEKALAIACMLIAAATDNKIPFDPTYIKRVAYLEHEPNFDGLLKTEFIEMIDENFSAQADASKRLQVVSNVRPEERREEKRFAQSFDLFWKAYPKRKSRGQAEKAFMKINPDEQLLAVIVQAVERAKTWDDWKKDDGKFIPHPATWLNAKGWLDEAPASTDKRVAL